MFVGLCVASVALACSADGQVPREPARSSLDGFADSGVGLDGREDQGPAVGTRAPDVATFILATDGSLRKVTLWSLIGNRPVIVAFGSFT